MILQKILAAGATLTLLATASQAGAPDNPQAKRDLVHANQDVQTALNGASGFGKRISYRARNKSDGDRFNNFGDYLKTMTSGPNPANDEGGGND